MDEFKYVNENSKDVTVNFDTVLEFVDELGTPKYEHWSKELNLNLNEEKLILLFILRIPLLQKVLLKNQLKP